MYTLTGQQLTLPDPLPHGYGLTLAPNGASPRPALTFACGAGPLTVPLSPDDQAALAGIAGQLTQSPPIDTGAPAATRYPPYAVVPRQYALGKPVPWQAAAQPPLRYDPAGTGTAPAPQPAAASRPCCRSRTRCATRSRPARTPPDPGCGSAWPAGRRRPRPPRPRRRRSAASAGPRKSTSGCAGHRTPTRRASRCRTSTRCSASTRTRRQTCSSCSTTPAARAAATASRWRCSTR